jgi:hypothetical protein
MHLSTWACSVWTMIASVVVYPIHMIASVVVYPMLWSSEASTESSYNGVLGIGLDSPETGGDGSSAGSVDVGIGKRRMCSHRCGAGGRILTGDGV